MKYEISDILNDKYKYGLTLLRIHKKANKGVLPFLILKISIYNYHIFHFLYIFISSMGLLILCNNFDPDYKKYIYFSNWLRNLTPFSIVERLHISHLSYIIICLIIFVLCIIRLIYIYHLTYKVNHFHTTEVYKIKGNLIIRILNHTSYVLFSYIIEFLSFIYYIEIFPNEFVIKKDQNVNEIIHKLFFVLNGIFIIIYNINNYLFILLVNQVNADKSYPVRMKIPSSKIYILMVVQNFSLIHPVQCYLDEKINRVWCIIYIVVFFLILIWLYFIPIKLYNFNNTINSLLSFIGEFCFVSIIIEFLLFIFSIRHDNSKELIYYLISKLIITICLFFCLRKIYQKIMMKILKKRLFYNNPYNHPFDVSMVNSVLFLRELFEKRNMKYLSKIYAVFEDHKRQCTNNNCGCKIISIKNSIEKGDKMLFLQDLIIKLNYYIESILIHYNYQNNFDLSILLAEHFHIYKNNPIMSYSILQTLLHCNYKNLNRNQLIILYESMNKYINYILREKSKKMNTEKYEGSLANINKIIRETELKQNFNLLLKIKKAIKFMVNYSTKFIKIIEHKDNYETSTFIKIDEIYNEIKYISSQYLSKKILNKILDFLSIEIIYTSDIQKYLYDLDEYIKLLTYEFLYKIFLFVDYFWNGKIPDKLKNIFYSFTSNRNLYSSEINPEIYQILESRYNENFSSGPNKFYLLFKCTIGIKISYVSESLTRKLKYNQTDLINHNIDLLLIKDLIEPHDNIIKQFFILHQNYISKDQFKYIFDNNGYMINAKINSTMQLGVNKNILMIVTVETNQKNKEIWFYLNKNLNIISINKNFQDNLFLSLSLIKEFKIELKELFGIDINDINKNYKRELKKIKYIREYKIMDTREYILKNLFKLQNQNNYFHIINKYVINESSDESDKDNEEEKMLKLKCKKNISKFCKSLFTTNSNFYHFGYIDYKIDKETFLINLKKIFEKMSSYEQDKLESKNIYNDYLRLINKYNELLNNQNIFFNVKIEPRLIYDTSFYNGRVELYVYPFLTEINNNNGQRKSYELKNIKTETDELNSTNNNSKFNDKIIGGEKMKRQKTNISMTMFKEDLKYTEEKVNNNYKSGNNSSNYFREKIKVNKTSKYKLCGVLLICIFVLLISCIVTLNYQTNLVHKNDKIFDALYYNYYQRTQFIYLNSIILSIFYELVGIRNESLIDANKYVLHLIGKNIEGSHQLFLRYYMDFKIELNEDFTKLYEPLESNKITVNWENRVFYNDYNSELALIVYRILNSIKHDFDDDDRKDCEILLFGRYLEIDRKRTPVYGDFIKLVYYFYLNYETLLNQYFLSLENSFDQSLNDFSKRTTTVYLILEILALLSFLLFFAINIYFLVTSNKYIFQNILYMFLDFTQNKDYSFNNKIYNILAKKRVSNYILLLNEFTPQNLDALKNDKEFKNYSALNNLNLKSLIEDDINSSSAVDENKTKNSGKSKKKPKKSNNTSLSKKASAENVVNNNSSLFNQNSNNGLLNYSNNNNLSNLNKGIKNDDIHILNNKELNNMINNSLNNINNSTNIVLNSSVINSSSVNNNNSSLISTPNLISTNNRNRKSYEMENFSKILKNDNNKSVYDDKVNKEENEELKLTIDKILFQTKITVLNSIQLIIIIFIIFTTIFIVYYVYKLIVSLLFISNFQNIINDFKTLTSQYNHIIRYWNNLKTIFILPNTTLGIDLNNTEEYFIEFNSKVIYIYKNRIKRYKRISDLYDILLSNEIKENASSIDFCLNHSRCEEIKNSNTFLFSNGIDSTVNLYAKEITNFYKDFYPVKNEIKSIADVQRIFINEKYNVLSSNLNHVVIFLEELFFKLFLEDEIDIVNNFYLKIKILNIIEICYCALLNLFSVLFVHTFVTRIIYSVEVASTRINNSIKRMKVLKLESGNY